MTWSLKRRRREPKRHPRTEPVAGWFYRTLALMKRWLPGARGARGLRLACIRMTCPSHPSQWDGWLVDHRPVYIRYRFGRLGVSIGAVGDNIDMACISGDEAYYEKVGHEWDGAITLEEVCRLTGLRVDPSAVLAGDDGVPFKLDALGNPVPEKD
jgi:hypothetical protein